MSVKPTIAVTNTEEGIVDPDAALISAMSQGDSEALAALMELHLSSIKSLPWHMLGDDMAAEDVAQEVFLKSWIMARTWQPGRAKFMTWMRRVATNKCLDRLRKKREILSDSPPEIIDSALRADEGLAAQQSASAVNAALDTLPDRQRAAITLCHYQYLSQSEAADVLDISLSAYESLLARARRALATHLQPQKTLLIDGFGG